MNWSFLPHSPDFFTFFIQMADHIGQSATLLRKLPNGKNTTKLLKEIRTHEQKTNALRHTVVEQADNTFITPIDREDIHALARNLDMLIDGIEDIASRLELYRVSRPPKHLLQFLTLIEQSSQIIVHLAQILPHKENGIKKLQKDIQQLHLLESQGDVLIRSAMAALFTQKSAITILKWKDIFEQCENLLDHVEQTADTVNEIIIKNF